MNTVPVFGKYEFTAGEIEEKKAALPEVLHRAAVKEEAKKRVMAKFKTRIDALKAQSARLTAHIRDGHEWRDIQCRLERDFEKKVRLYYSVENGQLIKTEPFKPEDFQMCLGDNVKAFPLGGRKTEGA